MKTTKLAALSAALLTLLAGATACSDSHHNPGAPKADDDQVYTGMLPGADCLGIRYTLHLDYDSDDNNMKGDYKLVETYVVADSTATSRIADAYSVKSKGDFKVSTQDGATRLTLFPKHPGAANDTLYFVQTSDTTLTMTSGTFDLPTTPGLNYTLRLVK